MNPEDLLCHAASVVIDCPAPIAFAFMADGAQLGTWALGCWDTRPVGDGVFKGRSLFGPDRKGGEGFVRIKADAELMSVDYLVGGAPDALSHQNSARVVPGPTLGHPATSCVVTLLAWRGKDTDRETWHRLCVTHDAEMLLIQAWLAGKR